MPTLQDELVFTCTNNKYLPEDYETLPNNRIKNSRIKKTLFNDNVIIHLPINSDDINVDENFIENKLLAFAIYHHKELSL